MKRLTAMLLMGLAAGTAAALDDKPSLQVEGGGSYENLNNGYDDWTGAYLEGAWKRGARKTLYGGVRRTERFGFADSEAWLGAYQPLSERFTGVVEATVSPTHDVLPRWSALVQVEAALGGGFNAHLGWRHRGYADARTDQGLATVEYYFGNYRAAYTYYRTTLDGDRPAGAHRFALARYYGPDGRSQAGLAYSRGEEVENLGGGNVLVTDVRGAVLTGRHWFVRDWAITGEIGLHRALDRYRRNAVQIGVRHEF